MKADKVKTLKDMTRAELIRECEEKAQLLKQSFEAYAKVSAATATLQTKCTHYDRTAKSLINANQRLTHLLQAEVMHQNLEAGLSFMQGKNTVRIVSDAEVTTPTKIGDRPWDSQ